MLLVNAPPAAAQDNDVYQLLARINALRQQNGLLPLDLSPILTASAQRHSDDMALTGNIDHTGSDGSSIESRIREAGYGHWRDFGVWGENIYGGQTANVDAAWNFWTSSQVHRANLLNHRYREIGIGVGRSTAGGVYYTLNFGAQPNVLPFFVMGSAPNVTLLLTNENDITTGESVAVMGQATEVRIAEGADTSAADWQPWAELIPFQLSNTPSPKTITVEYRDELGRGSKMTRTVDTGNLATATPTPEPSTTPRPTHTATSTPAATAVAASSPTPTLTSTAQPTASPTAAPTETATPTEMPTALPTAAAPSTSTASPAPIVTLRPTARLTATPTPRLVAANLATLPSGSRLTPPPPRPAPTERPLFDFKNAPGLNTFAVIIGLQVIVLGIIGVTALMRWRRRS